MAGVELRGSDFGLRVPTAAEPREHPGIKIGEQDPLELDQVGDGRGRTPHVVHAGSIEEFVQRSTEPCVDLESREELLQRWEAQWEEFLRKLESPHLERGIPQLPEEPTPWDDAKAFLVSFELVAEACRWPREEGVARLLPALGGGAQQTFSKLESQDWKDYQKVKVAILRGAALRREKQRQHFRRFCYQEAGGPREAYGCLQERCSQWLRAERRTKEEILELLILEQFLAILPPEIQSWVKERGPESCAQVVILAEVFLQGQEEAERWQLQPLPAPFVEVAASSPEAEQAPSDSGQGQPCQEVKREEEEEEEAAAFVVTSLDKGQRSLSAEGSKTPEQPEAGRQYGAPRQREENNSSRPCYDGRGDAPKTWHRPEFQQQPDRGERLEEFPPCQRKEQRASQESGYRPVSERKRKNQRVSPQQAEPSGRRAGELLSQGEYWEDSAEDQRRWVKQRQRQRSHCQRLAKTPPDSGEGFKEDSRHLKRDMVSGSRKSPPQLADRGKGLACKGPFMPHQPIYGGSGVHSCSYCGKTFCAQLQLSIHERAHAGKKPYQCSRCPRAFSQRSHCIAHERAHSRRNLCQCSSCGMTFSQSWLLLLLERTHVCKKHYKCSYCAKSFVWKSQIILHERTHAQEERCNQEKMYKCSVCEESFSHRWLCAMHEGIHTGDKPYECSQCGKRFYSDAGLTNHERIHAAEVEMA
ncbi:zinc finger protein with KRAB and SCAN domains 7-like isoform X2 [Rhineura floridana]|uniref:zinc finger protein with KRAB and SCAN domains 7-like isoform X2 n=1 Tax=Rhineura floridana TaxID=261503 RepID=UPI002AC84C9C|nr:zinc finger protein with KRAB and SCAN domains 7-like isoform X2 [Rhineura floridana]